MGLVIHNQNPRGVTAMRTWLSRCPWRSRHRGMSRADFRHFRCHAPVSQNDPRLVLPTSTTHALYTGR